MIKVYALMLICALCSGCLRSSSDLDGSLSSSSVIYNLELAPCIGGLTSPIGTLNCRAQLQQFSRLFKEQVGGCFFVVKADDPEPLSTTFRWSDDGTLKITPVPADYQLGQRFNTYLYFMDGGMQESIGCEAFKDTIYQPCQGISGCMVKLSSKEQVYSAPSIWVSFSDALGSCLITHNPYYFAPEAQDKIDNDCDARVDE